MSEDPKYSVMESVTEGEGTTVYDQVNLYNCTIGDGTKIDAFVYIEEDVKIGKNCIIRPFSFIPTGITIRDEVFIGPGVTFTNDMYPSVTGEWELEETVVEQGVGIGAGVTVGPGVTIGKDAMVGAGAVVVEDVPSETTVVGNPAKKIKK